MAISHEEEYKSLRQEMLELFQRIHDILKWGVGGFVVFLSFYLAIEGAYGMVITDREALYIMLAIIAMMGLSVLRNYYGIYTIGTYIAVVIEKNNSGKWHRMSRQYDDYLEKMNKNKKKEKLKVSWWERYLPWPVGSRWGADSMQLCYILIGLFITSFGIVRVLKN